MKLGKAVMHFITWLLSVLATTAIEGRMVSVEIIRSHQNNKEIVEPLLHFPFIHSLVNPCDFQTDVVDSEEQNVSPACLRDSSRNGEIPFSQQVLDFLKPFRHVIDLQSTEPNSPNNAKMKVQLTQELKLVVSQSLLSIHRIYSPSVLRQCSGYQLMSLPRLNVFAAASIGEIHLEELYRRLMIIAAHLHVIIQDVHDSARFCPSENFAHLLILQQLIGKVKTSMCLMLQSSFFLEVDYFRVTLKVLQSLFFHRYYHCSTREIRECLVINFSVETFGFVQHYIDYFIDF